MLRKYYPWLHVDSVFDIDFEKLYAHGYRGLIFDIDNTLVHHGDDATPEIEALFGKLEKIGFRSLMLSNNDEERILRFLRRIHALYIADARKPAPDNYLKAVKMLKVKKSEAICIGDQVFTDILGANASGLASIHVHYIRTPGERWIGWRRYIEKGILLIYRLTPLSKARRQALL